MHWMASLEIGHWLKKCCMRTWSLSSPPFSPKNDLDHDLWCHRPSSCQKLPNQRRTEWLSHNWTINEPAKSKIARKISKNGEQQPRPRPWNSLQACAPSQSPGSRPETTTRQSSATSIKQLGFDAKMNTWMPTVKNHNLWSQIAQQKLNSVPDTHKPFKTRQQEHWQTQADEEQLNK